MNPSLEIGNTIITQDNIFSVLTEKQMIAPLAKEIILDRAIEGIECTQEEKEKMEMQFFQQMQMNPKDEDKLKIWLEKNYLTKQQLEKRILRPLKIDKYKEQNWGDQLQSYYLKRKSQLDRVVYSLIRTQNPGEAQELYFRIIEGEKEFAELARQHSKGVEAESGGLIGPVELNVPHPQIAQKLMTSEPGQVLPPIRIAEWIVILRLEKYIPAQLDQNLRRRLLDELFNTWLNETLQKEVKFNFEIPSLI